MKTFVIGDVHGNHKGLLQCLERSGFNNDYDRLIQLGDVADGYPEVPECIETLKGIKNLVQIMGNHDFWHNEWFQLGAMPKIWVAQGGQATIDAYVHRRPELMIEHRDYWKTSIPFFIDEKNRIYCHGGFSRKMPIETQSVENIMWDRTLAFACVEGAKTGFKVNQYEHVFLGHTTVNSFSENRVARNKPFTGGNVTLMDTGAGFEGLMTIMDVDSFEYWQSDLGSDLYPNHKHR